MKLLMFLARRILLLITVCILAFSGYYAILVARADLLRRENSLASLSSAVELVPGNAAYHAILAEHLEAEGANPDHELELATQLSPRESRYWVRRGFRAEVEGKYDESERYLLKARGIDQGFDPRWALMNYYFRRGRMPEFWKSTRDALEMSYGDRDPIFRLCVAASEDPAVVRQFIPPRRPLIYSFFTYLLKSGSLQAAGSLAPELAETALPEEVPILTDYCDKQLGNNEKSALLVWNDMCRRQLLPFSELSPQDGRLLTNGDFAAVPMQKGFDWRYAIANTEGVTISSADTGGVSIALAGSQADHVLLLEQVLPLTPAKQYAIHYEYRLSGTGGDSGLQWVIQAPAPNPGTASGMDSGSDTLAAFPVPNATDWNSAQITFPAAQRDSARLRLEYRRAPTTVRWQGTIQIRRVTSELAPAGTAK